MRNKIVSLFLVVLVVFAPWAAAQSGKGIITGRVIDQSGGVVPGAKVVVTDRDTGVALDLKTNNDGYFEALSLIPGTYDIEVQAPNFKTLSRKGITVQVEDRINLDLKLQVGQITESITITAEGPQLRTDDAQTGEVISSDMLQTLPSNNNIGILRDPFLLLRLSGDVQGGGERAGWNLGPNGGGKTAGVPDTRINGGRTGNVEYLVDGVPVTLNFGHTVSNATPSYDDVAEFKVVTNGIDAQYGRLSGGAVSVTTKSGSSELHGQLFEYYQSAGLNANSWLNNGQDAAKGDFHFNTFGGAAGGPVWIPKIYNGKNKTFWFFNYEGVRQKLTGDQKLTDVPTAAERQGDLSTTGTGPYNPANPNDPNNNHPWAQIYDPFANNSYPNINPLPTGPNVPGWLQPANGAIPYYERLQLVSPNSTAPGRIIPSSYLDPTMQAYLSYIPMPNHTPLYTWSDSNNFAYRTPETKSNNTWSARLDHTFSTRQNIFFRYNSEDWTDKSDGPYANSPGGFKEYNLNGRVANGFGTSLGYNFAITPTTILELRVGGNYSPFSSGWSFPSNFDNSSFHYSATTLAALGGDTNQIVGINAQEHESFNGANADHYFFFPKSGINYNSTNMQFAGTLTKILGRHAVKFGYEGRRYYDNFKDNVTDDEVNFDAEGTGQFVLGPTQQNNQSWSAQGNANGMGAFLMGTDSWMAIQSPYVRHYRENYYAAFVQDDFKLSPKLTLNLGLRWETESPITEKNNQLQTWNANSPSYFAVNPGYDFNAALVSAGLDPSQVQTPAWVSGGFPKGAIQLPGTQEHPSTNGTNWHPWNFAPRLGAAYQLTPLTVLRGSFAILYAPTSGDLSNFANNAGIAYTNTTSNSNQQSAGCDATTLITGNTGVPGHGLQTIGNEPFLCTNSQVLQRAQNNIQANYQSAGQYGSGTGAISQSLHMPMEYDWSFGIQRQLPWNVLVEAQYLGNHSSSLLAKDTPSRFPLSLYNGGPTGANAKNYSDTLVSSPVYGQGSTNPQQLALAWLEYPYPYYGLISVYGLNAGTSNFNALNLRLQKRFSDGFQFLFNYTWSKLLDDVGGSDNSAGVGGPATGYGEGGRAPQSVLGFKSTYGLDPTNQTSRISAVYSYQFPLGRGKKWLNSPEGVGGTLLDYAVGGWEISGDTVWHSGTPIVWNWQPSADQGIGVYVLYSSLAPGASLHSLANPVNAGRAVLVGPNQQSSAFPPSAFNLSAFANDGKSQSFTLGNIPAVYPYLRNPGNIDTDLSLLKNFPIFSKDGSRFLQLRLEALNVFNHPGLGNYNVNPQKGNQYFGYINSVGNKERHIQIAAKFVF